MQGRQIIFYTLKQDALHFFDYLKADAPPHVLLPTYWAERRVEPVASGILLLPARGTGFHGYLMRPEDMAAVQPAHLKEADSGVWYLSRREHPVIEVVIAIKPSKGELPSGRLYYTKRFRSGLGDEKSPEFLEWAGQMFKVAKKFFKHRVDGGYAYVGKHAKKWIAEGGKTCF